MKLKAIPSSWHFSTAAACLAFFCCAVLPPLAGRAQGQSKEQKEPNQRKEQTGTVLRIETELVQLDLVVTDREGKLVHDLRREDFELFEDGKPQRITHFSVGTATRPATWLSAEKRSTPKAPATSAAPADTSVFGRYLVLAVDDYHIAPENLPQVKRTLLRFVNEQFVGGDQIAVVTTSGNLGLLQQFTSERPVLERAINRLNVQTRTTAAAKSLDMPRISDYQAELIDLGDYEALQLAVLEIMQQQVEANSSAGGGSGRNGGRGNNSGNSGGGYSPLELARFAAQTKARTIVAENARFTQATLSTLEQLIRSLRPLVGRKIVVLCSDGFFLGGTSNSKHYDLRRITDAATRAGVVIYSLDSRGLVAIPPGGDASQPGTFNTLLPGVAARIENQALEAARDGLNALAYDTGGFLIINSNDLNAGLQRVLNDNETYYVLAYEPEQPYRDGRFHQLEVRLPKRPDLKVRTRRGYFAPDAKELAKAAEATKPSGAKAPGQSYEKAAQAVREAETRAALASLFPLRELRLELAADYLDLPPAGAAVIINAVIDAASLNLAKAADKHRGELDVALAIFDERGKTAFDTNTRVNLNLSDAELEGLLKQGLLYPRLVPLKPGLYQVRVAVREEGSARLGSAINWVEVPDLSKQQLTLSSVILSNGAPQPATGITEAADKQIETALLRPLQRARRFKRGDNADFLVFAYNATVREQETDLVIQAQVFAGSKLIFTTPPAKMQPPENGELQRVPYAARLALSDFEPGEYELRLIVIDRLAKVTAQRRANFTVE